MDGTAYSGNIKLTTKGISEVHNSLIEVAKCEVEGESFIPIVVDEVVCLLKIVPLQK